MANEYLIRQTMKMFAVIATKLINPSFKFPKGPAAERVVAKALEALEKKCGGVSRSRIVDYCVSAAYPFKDRGVEWRINSAFGPKSIEKFNTDKARRRFEDRWLASGGLTRGILVDMIQDKGNHPLAKYIYMPMEENTKRRQLNHYSGYLICQSSTLGWSPESESCSMCVYADKCKIETQKKYPEIFRLRMENGNEK